MKRLASIIVAGTCRGGGGAGGGADQRRARGRAEQRYQIGQMERVLEGAVEHGVTVTRDRVQALAQVPADLLVSDNAHARGFRLEGYGVFFDVIVPSFETTLDLEPADARPERSRARQRAAHAADARQDRRRSGPRAGAEAARAAGRPGRARARVGAGRPRRAQRHRLGGVGVADGQPADTADPILTDPNEAYRTEVLQALKDAMLAHSSSLGIGPNEWLTIAAKGNDDRPRLAPADSGSQHAHHPPARIGSGRVPGRPDHARRGAEAD